MPHRETLVHRNAMRRAFDKALLGGVSLLALMMGSGLGEARSLLATSVVAPTAVAQQAALAAAQQAAGAAAQAQASLARAAAALAAARQLQLDAATAARALPSSVPDGLTTGGLMPAGGTASDPLAGIKPGSTTWVGGDNPTQSVSGSQVTVGINQTQPKGIFYWDTFNVGANTTVKFTQSGSDWIALNRVLDPSAAPSRILGQINAFGSVYLINRNGIIFGAGSQVDVHTLVASSLDIGVLGTPLGDRDTYFLKTGIGNLNSFSIYDAVAGAQTSIVAGDITVERGASIKANVTTDISALGSAPSVYLFGANVHNSGSITVPTGEVGMVAARTIDLVPNGYSVLPAAVLGTDSSGNLLTFRGTEFRLSQFGSAYGSDGYSTSSYLPGTGAVTHDGLIEASRGIVIMNGDKISIDNPRDANGGALRDAAGNLVQGVISVDTSIDRNSMVLLRAATSVSMNGVISSLPFDDGALPLPSGASAGSTVQSFTPAYIEMSAQSTVTVGSSGLVSAPSAQVALRAINLGNNPGVYKQTRGGGNSTDSAAYGQRLFNQGANPTTGDGGNQDVSPNSQSPQTVLLAPGAIVDVAGLANVQLPASYNFIAFTPLAEFADMPLQRPPYVSVGTDGKGPVYGQTLWIDIRASGTRSDGTTWVGTPLADASGTVNAVGRSVYQLMTVGGSVSMATDLSASNGNASVQTAGSVLNVAGGSVTFLPGMVNTTRLIGADGRIYSMANADPNMTYLGIAGQFTVNHARWGVKETWSTGTQTFAPGYTEGHDAGNVSVTTVTPSLDDGTMYFGSAAGRRQTSAGTLPLQGSLALTTPSSVQIGPAPSADYTTQKSASTTLLSADTLSGYGLSALTVTANDFVVSGGSTLNLAPGGSLSVTTGGAIDIAGTVSAAGGAINLVTDRRTVADGKGPFGGASSFFKPPVDQAGTVIAANVFVEGTLDVSGRFVNDSGRTGTNLSGPAFINGGTISITTNKSSDPDTRGRNTDTTGSIVLAKGSVLDVSSGGYISPQGKPKTVSTGVMAGKAGSISLAIYQGKTWDPLTGPQPPNPAVGKVAVLQLDGSLLGYGFQSNGSLRLAGADTVRIGGSMQPGETSTIRIAGAPSTLPVSLLTGGGFGSYTIESVTDDWSGASANVIVSAGTSLTLQQQNLSSLVDYSATATGTKLSQRATPALALLPDDQRKPVDLAFKADNIKLDTGSRIVTDPKATITFGGINVDHTLKASDPLRNVAATNVDLRGSIIDHSGNVFVNARKTHLGPQALVDLSGTFVANSRFGAVGGPATSGTFLSGGTFAVEAGQIDTVNTLINTTDSSKDNYYYTYDKPGAGYLVADTGATVDVSGAAGTVQVAGVRGATTSLWSWSDAGTVSADVTGFAWGGSFVAAGGRYLGAGGIAQSDPRANNGTFILGGGSIFLRQDTTDVQSQLSSPQALFVSADQLAPFDNIFLYGGAAQGGAARYFNELPAYNRLSGNNVVAQAYEVPGSTYDLPAEGLSSLFITGSLNWHVENGLRIAANTIASLQSGQAVALDAPYVLLTGGGGTPVAGSSTLRISGQTIDVEGAAFSGFVQASLISSGDIRLSTPKVSNSIDQSTGASTNPASFTGSLASAGDLLLSAQRIYPVTAVDFTVTTPDNVTFAAPAGSNTAIPLAAGGSLTVIANNIYQGGNLFAPLGKITLGNTDSTVSAITTQSVVLEPGSLTSVTLADTIVPYGATADGINWYYNASLKPLSLPPSKGLTLAGTNVTRSDGSTIDLRGGGDLQAMEWFPGKGGSRDTLTTTPSGQTVYALLPSQSAAVSAFDIQFTAARNAATGNTIAAGDVDLLAGTQITIAGGNGIPAGTYTLYPAHYATLPGALRVVYYGDNTGRNIPTGTTLPDGTVLVSGHYTQSTSLGKQSSGNSLFAVQTSAVWQQYSEYAFNRANSYFTQLAAKQGTTVPRLPMDAGRLSVVAQQSILLAGIALTQPGQDSSGNTGRGGELDISAPQMAVIGHDQFVENDIPTGFVGLDVTQINGFESVLIGGKRSDTATGTLITPTASTVVVDTHGEAFTAPEILLVAAVAKPGQLQTIPQALTTGNGQGLGVEDQIFAPASNSGTVRIASGSVIVTTGIVHAGAGRNYYFATPASDFAGSNGKTTTAQDFATALGGKIDATGTVITGADISKLDYFVKNADGSFVTNPDGSIYRNAGTIAPGDLANLQNYSYQTTGLGALFVATNDTSLKVSGPTGVAPASLTIQFKQSSDPKAAGAINGSLLLPADAGHLTIETGVSITSKAVTLQATASTNAIVVNSADLHLQQLNVTARTIGLGSPAPVTDKSVALYNQQFADVQAMSLKALSGVITVYGDYNPGSVSKLTLDAAAIVRADSGGSANVSVTGDSSSITLVNTGAANAATSPASLGGASLNFNATDIVLGGGSQTMLGYSQVNLVAADKVLVAGPGSLTLGAGTDVVDFNVAAQSILVAGATSTGGGSFAVSTRGHIVVADILQRQPDLSRPADSAETGGNLSLTGANIVIGTLIQAQAGTITLEATTGDVSLAPGAYLAAGGFTKTLVDVDTYLSGGKIVLKADAGNVSTDKLSVIDVAQSTGGFGYGGEIDVTALGDAVTGLGGNATLAGVLRGEGGPGLGGRFKLDIKGAADLTALADNLLTGGVTGAIDIHTRTGNLELSQGHTLKANAITLTADDASWDNADTTKQFGQAIIEGTVDARGYGGSTLDGTGQAGGQVAIYGANQVKLAATGVIDASTTHADERGGDVTVGIGWSAKGNILLQTGTQINVSGGTKGGLSGGTVTFRAPRDGNKDVKIWAIDGNGTVLKTIDATNDVADRTKIGIIGARSVTVDGFVTFDTKANDSASGIGGSSLGWHGIIDPAGWYKPDGTLATDGSWTKVSGWQATISSTIINSTTTVPIPAAVVGGGGSGATVQAVMGLLGFNAASPVLPANQTFNVTFDVPRDRNGNAIPGGVAATGVASTTGGVLRFTITSPGSGYGSSQSAGDVIIVPTAFIFGTGSSSPLASISATTASFKVVSAQITSAGSGYSSTPGTITIRGTSGPPLVNLGFTLGSGFSGQSQNGIFTPDPGQSFIPSASSIIFNPATQGTAGVGVFAGDASTNRGFFADTLTQVTQGTFSYNGQNYGFGNLFTKLQPLVADLGAAVVHVQPGVELVNSTGDITVKTNWNLAAGKAGNLQTAKNASNNTSFQYFDPAQSYVNFNYRLTTPWGGLEAGALTLRAAGNINVNASISDGFFQFGNYLDPTYTASVGSYLSSFSGANSRTIDQNGGLYTYYLNNVSSSAVPIAPYQAGNATALQDPGNAISPTGQDLATADLFPHMLLVCTANCRTSNPTVEKVTAPSSWSYSFTAGADVSSANPMARTSLASAQAGSHGDVIVANHSSYTQTLYDNKTGANSSSTATVNLPTMIRTGTGDIAIVAARDVILQDTVAPGVIYAAGVNTANPTDPGYSLQTVNGVSSVVPGNVDGFLQPRVLGYGDGAAALGLYYGPPTAAAFPEQGGDVVIDAQRDIVGYSGSGNKVPQYYQPWLLSDTAPSSRALLGQGAFAPSGTTIASQTAWWIQYGSFQQGFLSAGGNVTVNAGRDLLDVSVSLPTTGRVSGGLAANSTPVTHLYGSGNMVVRAGRNILGGSFYEGSGHASIMAGGAIGQNGTVSRFASSKLLLADLPLLAVDTGQIAMVAQGSIAISGVVNPAELQTQLSNASNPLQLSVALPLYMDTYGPDSKVRLVADSGDLTISIAPTAITDASVTNIQINAAASTYPASLEALALNGNLVTTGLGTKDTNGKPVNIPAPGIVLSPSAHGTFELLAQDNVDLTFGYPANTSITSNPRPFISAGAALIDTAFDPFQPDSGFGNAFSGAVLAHQDDAAAGINTVARIYAATGDITATGSYGPRSKNDTSTGYQRIEINRPTKVYAGRDILDLNIIVQNIHPSDVSTIEAGRNIYYTGYNNGGGLQVAGPGFFVVQAGGDIGPFLPEAHDNSGEAVKQEGIVSVGNSSPTPVGDIYVSNTGGSIGIYDQALLGPSNNPRRNALLRQPAGTPQGADIITLFGTKFGVDYQAVIDAYINPANATNVDHNYIAELQAFLAQVGKPVSATDTAIVFAAFKALPADLQHVFVDKVFFAELQAVGISVQGGAAPFQRGYKVINTMFPSSLGYTANALGGGSNGANQLVKTGDLNLLHSTIQTQLGGDISLFGPGGNIIVGPLATEPNPNLKLRDLGILTLGGGAINTFTDGSVLVNSSRVLTTQGGDVLMWSSNGNLDAGRGSKTTLSAPALQVQFDQNDYQSIDLSGFVTGAGIGTLRASKVARASNLYLLAPRGTVDFGTAGARSSGNLTAVATVILNQSNSVAAGTNNALPSISVPDVGALTTGSNTAGAAAKSADTPTAAGGNGDRASVFMVEVIGYGGDTQGQPSSGSDDTKPSDKHKQ